MINIENVKIKNSALSPYLLKINSYDYFNESFEKFSSRYSFYYELEIYTGNTDTTIVVNDVPYHVKKGDIIFRKPGDRSESYLPYSCYFLIFCPVADDVSHDTKRAHKARLWGNHTYSKHYENELLDQIQTYVPYDHQHRTLHLFKELHYGFLYELEHHDILSQANILKILYILYQRHQTLFSENTETKHPLVTEMIQYINDNIRNKITVDLLAKEIFVSNRQIHNLFKTYLNMTPNQYITQIRMRLAKNLLESTNDALNEIASKVGYDHLSYFTTCYSKYWGVSPSKYRKTYLGL